MFRLERLFFFWECNNRRAKERITGENGNMRGKVYVGIQNDNTFNVCTLVGVPSLWGGC